MSDVSTITASEFQQYLAEHPVGCIVDVRTEAEHNTEHLEDSFLHPLQCFDLNEVSEELKQRQLSIDHPVMLLCQRGMRAHQFADKLKGKIDHPIIVIEGGVIACREAGISFSKKAGKAVLPLERQVRITMGALVLIGIAAGLFTHPVGYLLSAFVGAGMIFAGVTDKCPMAMAIARMPWNRA